MFELFKNRPTDVKGIRNAILQFIKEQLQKAEGGEGRNIHGIYVYINCLESERYLYESAVRSDNAAEFKNDDLQKIADDYNIGLPATWTLEIFFDENIPVDAIRSKDLPVSVLLSGYKHPASSKQNKAFIEVLAGEAEQKLYTLTAQLGKINIGRGAGIQTNDGFFRKNAIAFVDTTSNAINRAVSRQHAHIEWDNESGSFFLFADAGGIPPHNKVKVQTGTGNPVKLLTVEIGHRLQEGDQVILGESALLAFTYSEK